MEKKQDYDAFMNKERDVFELGKKHLANMMGNEKRENMTQEEIDAAIQYLFPSGLEEKGARPLMKPPEEIFPLEKGAEFNVEGRPFNPFFYTAVPKYVGAMHSILGTMNACMDLAESNKAKGIFPDEHSVLSEANLSKSRWMSKV